MRSEGEERLDFESSKVCQKSLDYIDFVCMITESFPKTEVFSLLIQTQWDCLSCHCEPRRGAAISWDCFVVSLPAMTLYLGFERK